MKIVFAIAAFAAATVAQPASAAVTINFEEFGVNVVATTSGTLDLTGLLKIDRYNTYSFLYANAAVFSSAPENDIFTYNGFSGIPAFGTGGANRGEGFGDTFHISGKLVGLATGYVSGGNISAGMKFANATFADPNS